jgi:hypothetical protein
MEISFLQNFRSRPSAPETKIHQLFFSGSFSLEIRSQDWLPTVQLVLHAD